MIKQEKIYGINNILTTNLLPIFASEKVVITELPGQRTGLFTATVDFLYTEDARTPTILPDDSDNSRVRIKLRDICPIIGSEATIKSITNIPVAQQLFYNSCNLWGLLSNTLLIVPDRVLVSKEYFEERFSYKKFLVYDDKLKLVFNNLTPMNEDYGKKSISSELCFKDNWFYFCHNYPGSIVIHEDENGIGTNYYPILNFLRLLVKENSVTIEKILETSIGKYAMKRYGIKIKREYQV